jgi:hypothetical protein
MCEISLGAEGQIQAFSSIKEEIASSQGRLIAMTGVLILLAGQATS